MIYHLLTVNLLTVSAGIAYAWSSPVIPKITGELGAENNPFESPISVDQKAWITAMVAFGEIFGCPLGWWLATALGKKKALLFSAIPKIVANLLIGFYPNVIVYLVGRFVLGLLCGVCFTIVPLYVGEVAEVSRRGEFGCYFGICLKLGMIFVCAVGPYTSVKVLNMICCIPLIVFVVVFAFFPETPYHLVSKGNFNSAEMALTKFRSERVGQDAIKTELIEIKDYLTGIEDNKNVLTYILRNKSAKRSLIIAAVLLSIQQASGILALLSYMQSIFIESGSASLNADISAILVSCIQLFTSVFASKLIDRYGRRKLLIISSTGALISLITLSGYFALKTHNFEISVLRWTPLTCLTLFVFSFAIGLGPVTWALCGEIFETSVQFTGSCTVHFISNIVGFVETLVFPYTTVLLGMEGSFGIFSILVLLGLIFIVLFVPETKNKSFGEIRGVLNGKWLQV